MLLSKLSRNCTSSPGPVASIILLTKTHKPVGKSSQREFSINEIGKRYEKPWDYKKKDYGLWGQATDSTLRRLGENSLLITVEGNFGAGKSEFAKKLAEKIDFVYAREPDLDFHLYSLQNGENIRKIVNEYVGENERFHLDSLEDWHLNPNFKKTISLQHAFYNIRWMQTRTALLHLLSTGQGVVLERSCFSDSVIGQALYDNHLLSDQAYRFYARDLIPNTLVEIWRPHLMIYLDKSPEECFKTIKEKGKPYEKESKVYTLDFLKSVDKNYKRIFLPEMKNHLHILSYQPKELDTETVVEDMETLDFEDQSKFFDWRIRKETTINTYRKILSNYEHCVSILQTPTSYTDVPEYLWYGEDFVKLVEHLENDPRYKDRYSSSLFGNFSKRDRRREWL